MIPLPSLTRSDPPATAAAPAPLLLSLLVVSMSTPVGYVDSSSIADAVAVMAVMRWQ